MGRRSRTRTRSQATGAGPAAGAARPTRTPRAQEGAAGTRPSGGRRMLAVLNPRKGTSRRRVTWAAVAFAVAGLVFAAAGLVAGRPEWYRSAMLLGLLALVWGVRAGFMSDRRE
jgi:hypothetical protein